MEKEFLEWFDQASAKFGLVKEREGFGKVLEKVKEEKEKEKKEKEEKKKNSN